MTLVSKLLEGIGLNYAVPSFAAAGIDDPKSLSELSPEYFEALGVTQSEDRRKLFFLVQRIKLEMDHRTTKNSTSALDKVNVVLSQTMNGGSAELKENDDNQNVSSIEKTNGNTNNNNNNDAIQSTDQLLDDLLLSDDKGTHQDHEDDFLSTAEDNTKSESDWEEDDTGASADDEDSSFLNASSSRRTSKRLADKREVPAPQQQHASGRSQKVTAANRRRRQSQLVQPPKRSISATSRRKSDAFYMADSSSGSEFVSSNNNDPRRRLSGVPTPTNRTTTTATSSKMMNKQPKSMRTGKQLSSIPSNSVAPMSPLVDLKSTSLEHHSMAPHLPAVKNRRRTLSQDRSSESDSSFTNRRHSAASTARPPRNSLLQSPPTRRGKVENNSANSFKTQIERLREQNNADYELFDEPDDSNTEEEMRIRVVVRKRPMSSAEIAAAGDIDVIHPLTYGTYGKVLVYNPKTKVDLTKSVETLSFAFDNVFDQKSTNVQIYEQTVRPLIPSLFSGQWASVFAYGQTGSGKTFTMMGQQPTDGNCDNLGLYYMASLDLFQAMQMEDFANQYRIEVSLFEIYGGKLFDLLHGRSAIKCLEDSQGKIRFPGLTEHFVDTPEELMTLIQDGGRNRSTGTTSRNADSSRSHAVMQLHLKTLSDDNEWSRLTFIDLAGSERGADTATASRATQLEGAEINTSLLALKEVIRALATGDSMAHVPFRGSKLTQVLKESFVGADGRSVMIACVSPNIGNVETTLNTLRYADRVKERNAETGAVPTQMVSAKNNRRRHHQREESCSNHSLDSSTSGLLDELLGSSTPPRSAGQAVESESRMLARQLIGDHKYALQTMLDMVKDEMTLVNEADNDRNGLEDYIASVHMLHEEQLSMIASLREHLLAYRLAQSKADDDDDDSFEDLRD